MPRNHSERDPFKSLTWSDIEDWAGSKIMSRGKSYQKSRTVKDLALTPKGAIIAWVQGSKRYATEVLCEAGKILSTSTCPYDDTCKHAVAVVLEYLDCLKKNINIPTVSANDRRLELLESDIEEQTWNEEDDEYAGRFMMRNQVKADSNDAGSFLEGQSKEQLISLVKDLAERNPTIRKDLQDRKNLSEGNIKQLMRSIQTEIREVSSEPGWTNHWKNEGYIPDYTHVKERLKGLLGLGHADAVVTLGRELLEQGAQQVSMSHDEGETSCAIGSCMEIIFKALVQSSLPPAEKMLWAVEAELNDEYELCYGAEFFWKQKYSIADWNDLAEKLVERLNKDQINKTNEDSFSKKYHRDRLSDWVIHALDKAGRKKEIIPLCEQEVEKTGSYQRLVNLLIKAKRLKEAEQWIYKGIKATQKQLPGIASSLRDTLREIREKEGDWMRVASFRAEDFFQYPSLDSFQKLQKTAQKAKVLSEVRAAALQFLETGKRPQSSPSWPLSHTGTMETAQRLGGKHPLIETLIDIALAEKRIDDVIHWYDIKSTARENSWWVNDSWEDGIAVAIADSYPDRALAIWKKIAEKQISLTQPKYYEVAARYLRKVNRLLIKLGREKDWHSYVSELRIVNAKKKRFIEILDKLTGRPIVEL